MSVTSPVPDEHGVAFTAVVQDCFYRHNPLSDPAMHWAGSTGSIYVHSNCFGPWVIRWARDQHEIENPSYWERVRGGQR